MSQQTYRANLSAASFPLLASLQGRTIVVGKSDATYAPQIDANTEVTKDIGIPQLFYCHNVLPHAQGYIAVSYDQIAAASAGALHTGCLFIKDPAGNKGYVSLDTAGTLWVHSVASAVFTSKLVNAAAAGKRLSVAYVAGESYLYVENIGCYRYDFGAALFVAVVLTGLVAANIVGLTAASGYMVAWDTISVSWSSLITPTDFTPSLLTGAGGGTVENTRGKIVFCLSFADGFYVHTTGNIVVAQYQGNIRYPFKFRDVSGSGGIQSPELAAFRSHPAFQYTYTTKGMQLITPQGAVTTMPEVIDFIAGTVLEDFDESTLSFSYTKLNTTMKKELVVVSDRYLVISYGIQALTHALIYDTVQKRWGKLKFTHVACFEYQLLAPEIVESAKKGLAFMLSDGTIKVVNSTLDNVNAAGVAIVGKFQYVRSREIGIDKVEVENIPLMGTFDTYLLPAEDGKNFGAALPGYLDYSAANVRKYLFNNVALNQSLLFKGAFHLTSLVLSFFIHGKH